MPYRLIGTSHRPSPPALRDYWDTHLAPSGASVFHLCHQDANLLSSPQVKKTGEIIVQDRYKIWQQAFSHKLPLDPDVDLRSIAEQYALSGGLMMNVVRRCTLKAVTQGEATIAMGALEEAIRQELQKEGILII